MPGLLDLVANLAASQLDLRVFATIPVGDGPVGVTYDGTSVYVTNRNNDTISVINPTANTITAGDCVNER